MLEGMLKLYELSLPLEEIFSFFSQNYFTLTGHVENNTWMAKTKELTLYHLPGTNVDPRPIEESIYPAPQHSDALFPIHCLWMINDFLNHLYTMMNGFSVFSDASIIFWMTALALINFGQHSFHL